MASTETLPTAILGEQGQPCHSCGAPLAADQRYCLNCGERRGERRLDYESLLHTEGNGNGARPPQPEASAQTEPTQKRSSLAESPLAAVLGIGALGLMLLLGVLIGKGNSGDGGSSGTPVVQVGGSGATAADTSGSGTGSTSQNVAAEATFKSDWPAGKTGYTVELGTVPKSGTSAADVDAQKQAAEAKGAGDVGALDSDLYKSLPAGKYVIYSGVYDTKAEASKALGGLKKDFPTATVVKVSKQAGGGGGAAAAASTGATQTANSAGDLTSQAAQGAKGPVSASDNALKDLNSQSGQSYEDAIKKLPDQISTQGKQAPLNPNKQTGGGSGTVTIGG
ncbi:MAG: zinc ribbon domain-containing protein [Solirubrobacterales bacterium]